MAATPGTFCDEPPVARGARYTSKALGSFARTGLLVVVGSIANDPSTERSGHHGTIIAPANVFVLRHIYLNGTQWRRHHQLEQQHQPSASTAADVEQLKL